MMVSTLLFAGIAIAMIGGAPLLPTPITALYVGMAIIGLVNIMLIIPMSTLIQTLVEDKNMGKVNGIIGSLISLTQVGGAAVASNLVVFFPVAVLFQVVGVFLLLLFAVLVAYLKVSGLDKLALERQELMIAKKKTEKEKRIQQQQELGEKIVDSSPVTI